MLTLCYIDLLRHFVIVYRLFTRRKKLNWSSVYFHAIDLSVMENKLMKLLFENRIRGGRRILISAYYHVKYSHVSRVV